MIYKFFDKKSSGSGIVNNNKENIRLADKLHKPIIGKFKKRTVYFFHLETILGAQI